MSLAVFAAAALSSVCATLPLTLEAVLSSADVHYPAIIAAQYEADAARAELLAQQGQFDPNLRLRGSRMATGTYPSTRLEVGIDQPTTLWGTTFSAGYRVGNGSFPVYYGERETLSLGEARAGVSVPLWRNGATDRRRTAVDRADLDVRASDAALVEQRIEVARGAAYRYYEWVAAGLRERLAAQALAVAVERAAGLKARELAGDLARIDWLENERSVMQRRGIHISARRGLEQSAFELSLYLRDARGQPRIATTDELPSSFPVPAAALSGVQAGDLIDRRPDLLRLSYGIQSLRLEEALWRNQSRPLVDLFVGASRDMGQGKQPLAPTDVEFGLSIELPLLTRAANGREQNARIKGARLGEQLRLLRDRATTEFENALSAADAAAERTRVSEAEADIATELERAERERFELGDGTLLFVNLRELQSLDAQVRIVDAQADAAKAAITSRVALGLRPWAG